MLPPVREGGRKGTIAKKTVRAGLHVKIGVERILREKTSDVKNSFMVFGLAGGKSDLTGRKEHQDSGFCEIGLESGGVRGGAGSPRESFCKVGFHDREERGGNFLAPSGVSRMLGGLILKVLTTLREEVRRGRRTCRPRRGRGGKGQVRAGRHTFSTSPGCGYANDFL